MGDGNMKIESSDPMELIASIQESLAKHASGQVPPNVATEVAKDVWERMFPYQVAEAQGFYNAMITVASAFLGGLLIFLRTLSNNPLGWLLIPLFIGYLALVAAIVLTIWVRRVNIESARLVMMGCYTQSKLLGVKNIIRTNFAIWCLAIGIISSSAFGIIDFILSRGI
jgi:hypothetical protein